MKYLKKIIYALTILLIKTLSLLFIINLVFILSAENVEIDCLKFQTNFEFRYS